MDLTFTPSAAVRAPASVGSRYLAVLGGCLLGYALLGRTFAYIGLPPFFIGEALLFAGLAVAAGSGRLGAAFAAWPVRLWALLFVWTLARTLPYVSTYAFDAARDAMLIGYGLYAVVVAALLLAAPDRLRDLVARYRTLVVVMLALAWAVYGVAKVAGPGVPRLPWAPGVGVIEAKGGDFMVHVTGIVAYLMLGGLRSSPAALAMAAFSAGVIMVSNRGGMVAFALGLGLVWLMRPPGAGVGRFVYAFAALVVVGLIVGPLVDVEIQGGSRDVSIEQVVENVKSVFGSSGSDALDGTKRWRLLWWGEIVDYTFGGPYFWTGKGFGINLAESDGFVVDEDEGLRSPHNGHLTVLARAGVPGLLLWTALHLSWFGMIVGAWARSKRLDQRRWTALFAWLAGFWLAALVNGSFDVFLEGPMGGIWLWSVMGVGIAAARLQRTHPHLLDPLDLSLPPTHDASRDIASDASASRPAFAW